MKLSWPTRTTQPGPIGLDLGTTGARAVQLVRAADRYRTLRAAHVDFQAGADAPTPAAQAIRACLQKAEFRGRSAVSGLNCGDDEFHLLELPQAVLSGESAEISAAAHWEVVRLMNAAPNQVEVRHWPLPPAAGAAPTAMAVGAARDAVEALAATCAAAGLHCPAVDTTSTALVRFGSALNRWSSKVVWGLLDLGCLRSILVLCVDDVPVLVRNVGSGGAEWTQRIADLLHLSGKAADVHKRQHGIGLGPSADHLRPDALPQNELGGMLLGALRGDLNSIAAEIKRSYEYALSCYSKRIAGDLVLVGGGARMHNLAEFWAGVLGIPVRRASDYLGQDGCRLDFTAAPGQELELMAAAIGLAIDPE
jgi:Tfp pilus assembly PilM family ATPase